MNVLLMTDMDSEVHVIFIMLIQRSILCEFHLNYYMSTDESSMFMKSVDNNI